MKKPSYLLIVITIIVAVFFIFVSGKAEDHCLTGAFIADKPTVKDIEEFQADFGKKPYLVMVFVDWDGFINHEVIQDVYSKGCVLLVTWEPWHAEGKKGVDYDALLAGGMDPYIADFAARLGQVKKPLFLRFAHEMNGNWYPWSASKIGAQKYIAVYRHVRDIFDKVGVDNVEWIFSINWENVPKENNYMDSYPGDEYVDFIGIDGYNWGKSKTWSRWMSFKEIFEKRHGEAATRFKKPVIITEFSSTSEGGDKALWIKEAMAEIKEMNRVRAFVLFNVDKETNWSFSVSGDPGRELRSQLKDDYFKDKSDLYD